MQAVPFPLQPQFSTVSLIATSSSSALHNIISLHCRRNRALTPGDSPYVVVADSITIEETGCEMDILNTRSNVVLRAEVSTLEDSSFRLKIKEKSPLRPRYEVEGALASDPKLER